MIGLSSFCNGDSVPGNGEKRDFDETVASEGPQFLL